MRQVERNEIRQMLLDGLTLQAIAQKRNMTTRQIKNYVSGIRREDYQELAREDRTVRATAIQLAKAEFSRLKLTMLTIVFGEKSTAAEKIAAAELARQFELDLVNLRLNGPIAIGLSSKDAVQRYLPRVSEPRETIPESERTREADDQPAAS
jgi:hypothetical protein